MMPAVMLNPPLRPPQRDAFETSPFRGFGEVSNGDRYYRSPAEPAISPDWHELCDLTRARLGVAPLLPHCSARGGARNHADRESCALTVAHIANLTAAAAYASVIGLPLTRMVTIHWEAAGLSLPDMAKATGRYIDLMTKALARHRCGTAWLWVHEAGEGKGGHCHLLAHVPPDFVPILTTLQRGWLRRITAQPYRSRVVHSRPIGGRLGLETGNPDLHAVNLETALAYVLKGASAEAAAKFALVRLEPGGRIIGKRCGTSQNIGAKARKGWSDVAQIPRISPTGDLGSGRSATGRHVRATSPNYV